jgi:opacity protein-like surface antigen
MNRKTSLVKAVAVLSMAGLTAAPGLSQAAGGMSFYAGGDVVQLTTDGGAFGESVKFTTQHLRLKGGMNVISWLAIEAQLVSDADDTDTDGLGNTWKHDTGFIFGVFAKPHVTVGPVDLYGLLGYATAEATLDCSPSCPPEWDATLDGLAYGLGAQFLVTKQLKISLDYMVYHDDSTTYDDGFFPFDADVKTSGLGLGVNYTF